MNRWKNYLQMLRSIWTPSEADGPAPSWIFRAMLVLLPFMMVTSFFERDTGQSGSDTPPLDPTVSAVLGGAAILCVLFVLVRIWSMKKAVSKMYLESDPVLVTKRLRAMTSGAMLGAVTKVVAAQCSMVYSVYGRFDQARRELNSVEWRANNPLILVARYTALGLLELMDEGDPKRARATFQRAMELFEVPDIAPGAKRGKETVRLWIAITEVVAGDASEESKKLVADAVAVIREPMLSAVAGWALAVEAVRRGDAETARRMLAHVDKIAPHCVPLHQLPASATAA